MSSGPSQRPFKRSKNGCMACKQKRKKCDEEWPCSRCIQVGLECVRAPGPTTVPVIRFVLDTNVQPKLHPHSHNVEQINFPTKCDTAGSIPHRVIIAGQGLSSAAPENLGRAEPRIKRNSDQLWEYAQDYGPRVMWPPSGPGAGDRFDPEEAIPVIRQSIVLLAEETPIEPVFQEMCNFYLTFLNRVIYNYALTPERIVRSMLRRFKLSESAKLGMLCTAVLFRSNYERSMLTPALYGNEKELYSLALQTLPLDLSDPCLSTIAKLTALTEIMNYEFYAGKLSSYYTHGAQAVPLVRALIGSNNIDLLNLWGERTFDVRCFAWCDIFDSLATSRPTHFTYESDLECLAQAGGITNDRGVEAIFECPNVTAVLLARITALRHARISTEERTLRGMELENLIRCWQFGIARARRSCMRIARLAVQEIWRHAAILYVHHTIFRSHPSDSVVRGSVKNVIKLSSVIQPGGNPDCFLQPAYFIAGTFATLQKDRYTLKGRILGSGNERYLRDLAIALEEIWEETDKTGRLSSWSKRPQSFVF